MDSPANSQPSQLAQALSLAWELGYTITVPLLVLGLGGRLADKYLGTAPWLLVLGVIMSVVVSTWLVYRKTQAIVSGTAELTKETKRE